MTTVRIPTPLRAFTEGRPSVEVRANTVDAAVRALVDQYPSLEQHLYDAAGEMRAYVSLFVNQEDIRTLEGIGTQLVADDQLMIVPSIAGGSPPDPEATVVDHSALRVNQASIITLTVTAFVTNSAWLAGLVGAVMLLGSLIGRPGTLPVYRVLRRLGVVRPDKVIDHREPHRFAQTLGGLFLAGSVIASYAGLAIFGWTLAWVVVGLAALNLFGGFCVGCAMYYWLGRLGAPGFRMQPPPGTSPGHRATQRPSS